VQVPPRSTSVSRAVPLAVGAVAVAQREEEQTCEAQSLAERHTLPAAHGAQTIEPPAKAFDAADCLNGRCADCCAARDSCSTARCPGETSVDCWRALAPACSAGRAASPRRLPEPPLRLEPVRAALVRRRVRDRSPASRLRLDGLRAVRGRQVCLSASDCASQVCSSSRCATATCTDGKRNGSETDVDCGGTCTACLDGKVCAAGTDAPRRCAAAAAARCRRATT